MDRSHAGQQATAPAVDTDPLAAQLTERFRQALSTKRMNDLSSRSSLKAPLSSLPDTCPPPSQGNNAPPPYSSIRHIPIMPEAPRDARSMRFKHMLHSLSDLPKRWENPGLLDEALRCVPLMDIYNEAEEASQVFEAEAESLGNRENAIWGYQDCVIMALMKWFKREFFTWVNNPPCSTCGSPTVGIGLVPPLPEEQGNGATQVEYYQCSVPQCRKYERYARYTDAFVLMRTRRGRVGEWANCFGMLCRALGSRVRWVWNSEDHVWVEIYSLHQKRWVHVDVCEQAWDKPRLYTEGWGKKMGYCIAFSVDGAMDVTRRYIRNPAKYGLDRNRTSEAVLLYILHEITSKRRANMLKPEKFRLQGEDMRELKELQHYAMMVVANEVAKISVQDILNGRVTRSDRDPSKAAERRATNANSEWISTPGQGAPTQQDPHNPPR